MTTSRRIALPLAVLLHLLAFYALERWWKPPRGAQTPLASTWVMHLLPMPTTPPHAAASKSATSSRQIAPPNTPKRHSTAAVASAPAIPAPTVESTAAPTQAAVPPQQPPLQHFDPAALVKAYSYEDSKSDLQKAIEAHGGTVEVVKKSKYEKFQETVDAASIPDCLSADGLKLDPPHIGPIALGGIFALPFVAHAAATGKCR